MSEKIRCETHGECQQAFVCTHLLGESVGLGFNREEPTSENPFPDAWCDDCDLIYQAHEGWTDESQRLVHIALLCSGCYQRALIRNTKPDITLDNLAELRWKCSTCDDWHNGPCLDFGYNAPHYWTKEDAQNTSFLNANYCAIEGSDFFVRGVIHLPIIGTTETFRWGVWGSLSKINFETLLKRDEVRSDSKVPPMFSWLSTKIEEYPDTLNLKMYANIQESNRRPHFSIDPTDHLLSQEYHQGIEPRRVREIMLRRLKH